MSIPVLALALATLSLILSVYTLFIARREGQLRKLAELRTKMVSVKWKWKPRTALLNRAARELDQISDSNPTWAQMVGESESTQKEIESLEDGLQLLFSHASRFPFLFRVGVLEELEHRVDTIIVVVDATREQVFSQLEKLLQDKVKFDELRARHPKSE